MLIETEPRLARLTTTLALQALAAGAVGGALIALQTILIVGT